MSYPPCPGRNFRKSGPRSSPTLMNSNWARSVNALCRIKSNRVSRGCVSGCGPAALRRATSTLPAGSFPAATRLSLATTTGRRRADFAQTLPDFARGQRLALQLAARLQPAHADRASDRRSRMRNTGARTENGILSNRKWEKKKAFFASAPQTHWRGIETEEDE